MKFKSLARKSITLVPWLLTAGFSFIYFNPQASPVFLFSIYLPLLLGIYEAHETLLISPTLPWVLGVYAVLCAFIFIHPNPPGTIGLIALSLQWILMGICVYIMNSDFGRIQRQILKLKEEITSIGETLKGKLKENQFYQAKSENLKSQ